MHASGSKKHGSGSGAHGLQPIGLASGMKNMGPETARTPYKAKRRHRKYLRSCSNASRMPFHVIHYCHIPARTRFICVLVRSYPKSMPDLEASSKVCGNK